MRERSIVFPQSQSTDEFRVRERALIRRLAELVVGAAGVDELLQTEDIRQLGYAADLVKMNVDDPENKLSEFVSLARLRVSQLPPPSCSFKDKVQERWGAPMHLSPRRLRTELPLHIMKLLRDRQS